MKRILWMLIVVMITSTGKSFAAFPVQKSTVVAATIADSAGTNTARQPYEGGGFGIASFVTSICAFIVYTLGSLDTLFTLGISPFHVLAAIMAVAAVALGIIGIKKKMKGLAIAGMALSLMTLIPFILLAFF